MLRRLSLCAATLALGVSSAAHADPAADACTTAYEGAQQLIRDGALLRGRAALITCEGACPKALAKDCQGWRAEVERQIPSLQVSAKEADGSDPGKVRVIVDGARLSESLSAAPIEVDPGKHTLTFESSAEQRVDVSVDVPQGRKGYAVDVRFPASAPRPPPPRPPAPRSFASVVLGSVGLGAALAGGVLGVKGQLDRTHLVHACAPRCSQADVDAIAREWTIGAVVGAAGGAAALAGTLWWLLDGRAPARRPAVTILPGPGSITLAGRF